MRNSIENKAKFFAQYYDQYVGIIHGAHNQINAALFNKRHILENTTLELKSLSSITDEDAAVLSDFTGYVNFTRISLENNGFWIVWNKPSGEILKNKFIHYVDLNLPCVDYLRSRGYALPWMGVSVEKLIEYGWIKLQS